jgi:hypothetical protein
MIMTIENVASAAKDTLLRDDQTSEEPEQVEVEYDGKTYLLPLELKDALLRQADYTRKAQEVAESRRRLQAAHAAHDQQAMVKGLFQDSSTISKQYCSLLTMSCREINVIESHVPARCALCKGNVSSRFCSRVVACLFERVERI